MMASPMCRRCQTGAEKREHIFWECPPAKDTWEQLHMAWVISDDNSVFTDWLKNTFETKSMALCRTTVCALWALWIARNKFIHEGENKTGSQIASFVQIYLKELDDLKSSIHERRICVDRWSAPMGSRLKVNFGAAFNNHTKESYSGLVIRNSKAEVICCKTEMNLNISFVFFAEAVACLQALKLGLQLGLREIEVEGDSRTIIRKLQEKTEERSKISVEANRVAHCLAQEGLKKRESTYLKNLVSPGAVEAMAEDKRQMEVVVEVRGRRNEEVGESVLQF
ncbi:hypothetical protein PVK06_036086 [Gossypium arboreum]|uniref:RNase H type-1 domain-containing protein n=1 Tax=Gossypium arboreum TaxID=29729 RepID=A0ABR0NKY8_GOSAR|nr:hypothetical protein PVK06_036086 [Gossypium arboreum]